ncbi:MAG: hypothetical protein JWN98_2503 [Abditibacteriota bacterium]|nr:hypothetical protein [Abditibacteriota bacterium]
MFERRFYHSQRSTQAEDDAKALRWRTAILKLSANFMEAADAHHDLSPVLMEALHNALENLLLLGDEGDLLALEEWLDLENAARENNDPGQPTDKREPHSAHE